MTNTNVTTLTLTADAPQTVEFAAAYPYYWINNLSDNEAYASFSTPAADGDGTYTIAAGSQLRIGGGAGGSINLLGNGKVQVIASGIPDCPFKVRSGGGDGSTADMDYATYDDLLINEFSFGYAETEEE